MFFKERVAGINQGSYFTLKGQIAQSQAGSLWPSPLRSDGSQDDQAEDAGPCYWRSRVSNKLKEEYQAWDHSEQMFLVILVIARQKVGLCWWRPTQGLHSLRTLKWELENNSRQLRNLRK